MKLSIGTMDSDLAGAAEFCRWEGIGIEITEFIFPREIGFDYGPAAEKLEEIFAGVKPLSVHGPFMDLAANSWDPCVVELCRMRHRKALELAHRLGAEFYVAHTNYNPLLRAPSYKEEFTGRMAEFWRPFADWAMEHGMAIGLENLWEPEPDIQLGIIERAGHPGLKISLDNGHSLAYSQLSSAVWAERFGGYLAHCHLHDNDGFYDLHDAIGTGKENWNTLLESIRRHAPGALLVCECSSLAGNIHSARFVRQNDLR